ncbi:unnamed protein product [Caenorhabditis auriculariae]|uniref:Uncharacterized protein n=1 Tax=Caenorhabditis auriculariae TaxID=2777116 RepID=A0A8S1HQ60_9PELO|nr:unnamed protein product [Caenorhabditis auriculariae]
MIRPRHGVPALVIARSSQPGKFMSRPVTPIPSSAASDPQRLALGCTLHWRTPSLAVRPAEKRESARRAMPKQILEFNDYLGAVAVWCVFFCIVFLLCIVLNFYCVTEKDDVTVLEEWGYRKNLNVKLGPHRKSFIARQTRQAFKHDH